MITNNKVQQHEKYLSNIKHTAVLPSVQHLGSDSGQTMFVIQTLRLMSGQMKWFMKTSSDGECLMMAEIIKIMFWKSMPEKTTEH